MKHLLCLTAVLVSTPLAMAQLPQIRLSSVFPAGAAQGSTVDVTVSGGTDLDEVSELLLSHPGLKAVPKKDGNGKPVANQFVLTVDPQVPVGLYDVRIRGLFGVSNPRVFRIDSLPEVSEVEPNNSDEQAQEVAVNSVVNARSNGGADVDSFRIAASAGQTIVIRTEAAVLGSLMQPVAELFTADGRRVAHARRIRQQDGVIVYRSEADQTLLLKIHDTVYAGSGDYVYRLVVDTRPQIDFVSPLVVKPGAESKLTVFGRYLPGGQPTEQTLDGLPLQQKEVTLNVSSADAASVGANSCSAALDTFYWNGIDGNLIQLVADSNAAPAGREQEGAESPPVLNAPFSVTGSFGSLSDEDIFRFQAVKGQRWQIEVLAHRLGSTADPLLFVEQITKAADGTETAKRLAREDTGKQNPGGANLPTLTSDPDFLLTAPEDGLYQIRLRDRFGASRGEADLIYSVSVRPPRPDFRVVVFDSLPSADGKAPAGTGALSLRKGGTYEVPVYVYRQDGHNDSVQIQVQGLPAGVHVPALTIPSGKNSDLLVFTVEESAPEVVAPVTITGRTVNGETVVEHRAQIATLVHDSANGLPRTGRVSASLLVAVMKDQEPFTITPGIAVADLSQDQQLLVPLKLVRRTGFEEKVTVAFGGVPGNVDAPTVAFEKGADSAVARLYLKENAAIGPASLLIYGTAAVPYRRNPWQVDRAKADVEAAVAELAREQKVLEDARKAIEASQKQLTDLEVVEKNNEQQLVSRQAAQEQAKQQLAAAVAGHAAATQQLTELQKNVEALNAGIAAATDPDAALKAVQNAVVAVEAAAKPVAEFTQKITAMDGQVAAAQKMVVETTQLIESTKVNMATQQKALEKAKADVAAAEGKLKAAEAAKKVAEDSVKKAEEASKPKNINVRSIAVPVHLTVHATPGKVTAAMPDGGAVRKGASVDVKITIARKNNFAGAVQVAVKLPEGVSSVTSSPLEIAADQTEGILKLMAAADASAGDIANAVIQATTKEPFNGRTASFETPVTLKIVD
ncbi:MAG: hypothetical protein KDA81_07340 [Planctomycetaceae bacterium]|nr:hypothetical protein [Planctomycetaceae bacterium]